MALRRFCKLSKIILVRVRTRGHLFQVWCFSTTTQLNILLSSAWVDGSWGMRQTLEYWILYEEESFRVLSLNEKREPCPRSPESDVSKVFWAQSGLSPYCKTTVQTTRLHWSFQQCTIDTTNTSHTKKGLWACPEGEITLYRALWWCPTQGSPKPTSHIPYMIHRTQNVQPHDGGLHFTVGSG